MDTPSYPTGRGSVRSRYIAGVLTFIDTSGNTFYTINPVTGLISLASLNAIASGHLALKTVDDNKTVKINSRNYTSSGNGIGFQCKPSQTVNGADIKGGEISPRVQSGITLSGSIIGLHVDFDLKGTAAGTITGDCRVLELEMVADVSGGRTVTGDVTAIRVRSFMPASGGVGGIKSVIKIEKVETGGVAYDGILDLKGVESDLYNDTDSGGGGSLDGFVKLQVNGNARYIRLYDAAPG